MRAGIVAVLIASIVSTAALAGESFRCGQWIISAELSVAELRGKCGEPLTKDSKTVEVRGAIATGGSVARGTSTTEHWTYKTRRRCALRRYDRRWRDQGHRARSVAGIFGSRLRLPRLFVIALARNRVIGTCLPFS